MSQIPSSREHLNELLTQSYSKLIGVLDTCGSELADVVCVEDWTVKDLLAVRLWWLESVCNWIQTGRRGETPVIPAEGYRWNETPRLNNDIVKNSEASTYQQIRNELAAAYAGLLKLIEELDDHELLDVGVYSWTEKWPLARWISLSSSTQFSSAARYVRHALKELGKR